MATITRIASNAAIIAVDAVADLLDANGPGRVEILDGTQPADPDTAITTQTVLAVLPLSNPAFAGATDQGGFARAVANAIAQDPDAAAAGTATWFRAYDGNNNAIIDGNVGTVDESMIINNVNVALNDTIEITQWHLEMSEV